MSLDKILAAIAEETKHIQLLTHSRGHSLPRLRLETDERGGLHVWEQTTGRLWAQFDFAGRLVGLTEILKEHYGPTDLALLVDREAAEAYDSKPMTGMWAKYENSHPVFVSCEPVTPEPVTPLPAPQEMLWGEWEPMSWITGGEEMFYTSGPRTGLVAARVAPSGGWSTFGKVPDGVSDQVCGFGDAGSIERAKLAAIEWLQEHWKVFG